MNPKIKVVGVGGSGSNTISRMFASSLFGVHFVSFNTDAQALDVSKADKKILIGKNITKGLGTGMDANLGNLAANEDREEILENLKGSDIVFITCGLGGGTGSGAGPVIAELSKSLGILTIAAVTMPFSFEGLERERVAKKALEELRGKVDSLLVIKNDNILKIIDEKTTVSNAFEICDKILYDAIKSIMDFILNPGIISIDFASVSSFLKNSGVILFGTAKAQGEQRMEKAAQAAIDSPLLDFSIKGSKGILLNISGKNTTLTEVKKAVGYITESIGSNTNIIFGTSKDHTLLRDEIKITLIATKS